MTRLVFHAGWEYTEGIFQQQLDSVFSGMLTNFSFFLAFKSNFLLSSETW